MSDTGNWGLLRGAGCCYCTCMDTQEKPKTTQEAMGITVHLQTYENETLQRVTQAMEISIKVNACALAGIGPVLFSLYTTVSILRHHHP